MTKVKTFKPFPSFKGRHFDGRGVCEKLTALAHNAAQLNDGTTAEFKKNQAVFVLPDPSSMKDPEGIPRQDEHWIGVIKEIRANVSVPFRTQPKTSGNLTGLYKT